MTDRAIWIPYEKFLGTVRRIGVGDMVYLSAISRSMSLQNVHLAILEARNLYHGPEIGLFDDTSCHLALIPSEYSSL